MRQITALQIWTLILNLNSVHLILKSLTYPTVIVNLLITPLKPATMLVRQHIRMLAHFTLCLMVTK